MIRNQVTMLYVIMFLIGCNMSTVSIKDDNNEEKKDDNLYFQQSLKEFNERTLDSEDIIFRCIISQAYEQPDYVISVRRMGNYFYIHQKEIYGNNRDSLFFESFSKRILFKNFEPKWNKLVSQFEEYNATNPSRVNTTWSTETTVIYELSFKGKYILLKDEFYDKDSKAFYLFFVKELPLSNYPLLEMVEKD